MVPGLTKAHRYFCLGASRGTLAVAESPCCWLTNFPSKSLACLPAASAGHKIITIFTWPEFGTQGPDAHLTTIPGRIRCWKGTEWCWLSGSLLLDLLAIFRWPRIVSGSADPTSSFCSGPDRRGCCESTCICHNFDRKALACSAVTPEVRMQRASKSGSVNLSS